MEEGGWDCVTEGQSGELFGHGLASERRLYCEFASFFFVTFVSFCSILFSYSLRSKRGGLEQKVTQGTKGTKEGEDPRQRT